MTHEHKQGDEVRWLISSTVCPSCNFEFESRERIVRHLQCNGSLLCRVFVFENCGRIGSDSFESLEKSPREYQALLRRNGRDRHVCEKKPFPVSGPIHPRSYFSLPRIERIRALKEVAANIDGKSYNSSLGCVWKVGSGVNRRVRNGTGSAGVYVGAGVAGGSGLPGELGPLASDVPDDISGNTFS